MRTCKSSRLALSAYLQRNNSAGLLSASSLRIEKNLDAILPKYFRNFFCNIRILAGQQLRPRLNDGHLATEPSKQLSEFKTDIAAAENKKMIRDFSEFHDGNVVQVSSLFEPLQPWARSARASVDEHAFGRKRAFIAILGANDDAFRAAETRFAEDEIQVGSRLNSPLDSAS